MVIVAHTVLENSSVLPHSTLHCTLELLNTPKSAIRTLGPYDSNLLSLFKLQNITAFADDDDNEEENVPNQIDEDEEDDFLAQLTQKTTYYTKHQSKSKTAAAIPDQKLAQATDLEAHKDMWTLDLLYAQVYGLAIADSGWLNTLPHSKTSIIYNDADLYKQQDALPSLISASMMVFHVVFIF